MDIASIILGVVILFGAGALFKATGFLKSYDEEGEPSPSVETTTVRGGQKKIEIRICRNCLSENPVDSEYCRDCGKKLTRPKDLVVSERQRKWFKRFGWLKNPFTPDIQPALIAGYKNETKIILEKLSLRSGHILVIGDFGVGKTTLLRWLELNLPDDFHPLYVFRPPEQFSELIDLVASSVVGEKNVRPGEYNMYNIDKPLKKLNKTFVLLIDEAHEFGTDISQPLKTLGDIEGVILVLAGLPVIKDKLRKEALPLYDRIVAEITLSNLTMDETRELIIKRIENVNGWEHEPFTDGAIEDIHKISGGNPRAVIKICDFTVTEATAESILTIDEDLIKRVSDKIIREKIRVTSSGIEHKLITPGPDLNKRKDMSAAREDELVITEEDTGKSAKSVIQPAVGKKAGESVVAVEEKKKEPAETIDSPTSLVDGSIGSTEKPSDVSLENVARERVDKINKLYHQYRDIGNTDGMNNVIQIAKTALNDAKIMLDDASIASEKKEQFQILSQLFEDWLKEHSEITTEPKE